MTESAAIAAETLVARSPSVVAAEVDGRLTLMNIDDGRYFGLNDVASDVWDRIESPRPFGDLVDDLAATEDAPA
ncbi:MAG: PqqD family protein [Actinomycetota bacterium]|nr:PqqD family protein [Actinomycetota bacterium]